MQKVTVYRQEFISNLRVFSMILIVLCHLTAQSTNSYIQMSAQFFNVGVEIFFLISGYLFGMRKISDGYGKWCKRRLERIIPSYYVFLIILFCVYLILGMKIDAFRWIIYIFGLQGSGYYLYGAEHLWFLTVLLVCYLITPFLDKIGEKWSIKIKSGAYLISIMIQIFITYFVNQQIGIYLLKINLYVLAYIIGASGIKFTKKRHFLVGICMGLAGVCLRISGRILVDGSLTYDVMIVGITQSIIAIACLIVFEYLFCWKTGRIIQYLDRISYEVYLVHYMLIVGPISVMKITDNYLVNCLFVVVLSVLIAHVVHKLGMRLKNLNRDI